MVFLTKHENNQNSTQEQRASAGPLSIIDSFFDDNIFAPFNVMIPSAFRNRGFSRIHTLFPKVDVSETDEEIKVVANIPGIDPKKVNIEVGEDYLSLSGTIEKEVTEDDKKSKIYRYEREFGEFRREFALPARVDTGKITARAKNGVLTIVLPKSEDSKKHMVEVQVDE